MLRVSERSPACDFAEYEESVLRLSPGVTEQDIDVQCFNEAKHAGVLPEPQEPQQHDPRASLVSFSPSATTTSTTSLRSQSIDSRNSFSTDLTSNFSRASTDRRRSHVFSLPLRSLSRFSSREGNPSETEIPTSRTSSLSLSLAQTSNQSRSSLATSTSSLRKPFSVRRGLGRLSMFKKPSLHNEDDSRSPTCHRCPNSNFGEDSSLHLDCGHTVCFGHFLHLLANAESWPEDSSATCCGPRDRHHTQTPFTPHNTSIKFLEPIYTSKGSTQLSISQPLLDAEQHNSRSPVIRCARSVEAQRNLLAAMASSDFKKLRAEQRGVVERFSALLAKQRSELSDFYASTRRERLEQQQKQMDSMRDAQANALARLEEQQLSAEIDLREVHEQEKCNCSLALRHMEGYLDSGRTVTEQDRRELEKQYWVRDHLELRQESAINVLREQQARQMRMRAQKHEKEMAVLQLKYQQSIGELDRCHRTELMELDELFFRRKARLVVRWGLGDEIWRRANNQKEGNAKVDFPIAPLDWPTARPQVSRPESRDVREPVPVLSPIPLAMNS